MQLNKEYLSLDKQSYNEYENNYKILEKYCNMCTYPEDLNVTLVSETGKVFYCKDYHDIEDYINWYTDYYKDYSLFKKYWKYKLFALEAIEDCSFINYGWNECWFSLDNGKNWYYCNEATPLPIVKAGKRMMFIWDIGYINHWSDLDGKQWYSDNISELGDYDFIEISNTGGFENNLNGDWDNKLKGFSIFRSSGKYKVVGDLSSLRDDCDYPTEQSRQYFQMFDGCENLVSAKNLYIPWQTICDDGLKRFFCNCVSLEEPPILFATEVRNHGYKEMFCGCISLKKHPIMCVQNAYDEAFKYMFDGCTSLEEIDPQIFNIDTLDNPYVYVYMYRNTSIKELKDINIIYDTEYYIFKGTFQGSKLTKISNVNFIEINDNDPEGTNGQFEYLFKDCNDLLSVENTKILFNNPYQRVISYKFKGMFENCYKLEYIDPDIFYDFIKFDDVEGYRCFENVFKNCYNLKNAPKLPLLDFIIDGDAFYGAFENCWSLEKAPDLNALWDQPYGYSRMFYNCKSLKYIKCNLITNNDNCLKDWVIGVPPGGTFVKDPRAQWDDIGDSGVPYGWTIDYQIAKDESLIFYYDAEMYNSNLPNYNELYLKNLVGNSAYNLNLVNTSYKTYYDKYITFQNNARAPQTMYTHSASCQTSGSTFELLVKFSGTDATGNNKCLFNDFEAGGEGFDCKIVTVNGNKCYQIFFESYIGNAYLLTPTYDITEFNYWWHLVGTRRYDSQNNKSYICLYVNGKNVTGISTSGQLKLPANNTIITLFANPAGSTGYPVLFTDISLSSARYYERPLTDEEIKKNFEWEKNRTGFEFLEI